MWEGARARSAADLAVDLGSTNTRVVLRGRGIVAEIPTVVATQAGPRGREVVAVGEGARRMIGRAPGGIRVIRPVRGGVVADFEATEHLLRHVLSQVVGRPGLRRPRVLVCIPSGTTEVERRAVQECARAAGARDASLVATAIAAALGAELPIREAVGSAIVDTGGGRTEVGVLSLGGLVVRRSAQIAGDTMDEAIGHWLRRTHRLLLGERTREALKRRVAAATPDEACHRMRVRGRDLAGGAPREVELTTSDVVEAIHEPVDRIRKIILDALQATPPELCADIVDRGLLLCGGGSHLRGLDTVLRTDTGLPVLQAEDPERCVARGATALLDDNALLERVAMG